MRSIIAPRLQFTHRRKASQAVGPLIGTTQDALLNGDKHTPKQAVSAYAEQRKIKQQKGRFLCPFDLVFGLVFVFIVVEANGGDDFGVLPFFLSAFGVHIEVYHIVIG